MTTTLPAIPESRRSGWSGVFALSLAAFALVASEFMPVSLLTPLASDFQITEGQAGLAISVSGAFALLTSLTISRLTGRTDRKLVLLGLSFLMLVSGAIAAFAPDYASFMVARAFIGVAIGGFWSMSAATAIRLVSPGQVPKALAIVNGGNALATVIAAPLGSFLGALIGWRGAFFFLVPVVAVSFAWKMLSLPAMRAERAQAALFTVLRRPGVGLGLLAVSLFFMGQFTLYTYLRPFLESATQVDAPVISLLLLLIGIAGVAGTATIGVALRRGLHAALIAIPAALALVALALVAFGGSMVMTTILLALWGLLSTSAPVAWWTWLARTVPDDAEAGGGLMVAVVQIAIALGATGGGYVFDRFGYSSTFELSAALLVVAAILAALVARSARGSPARSGSQAPSHLQAEAC